MLEQIKEFQKSKLEFQTKNEDLTINEINLKFQLERLTREKDNFEKLNNWLKQELSSKSEELSTFKKEKVCLFLKNFLSLTLFSFFKGLSYF